MIADTPDIHGFSAAQRGHADDLSAVAADLQAATVAPDALGPIGAGFVAALNRALLQEAKHASHLVERFVAARDAAGAAAEAYRSTEIHAGQTISRIGS